MAGLADEEMESLASQLAAQVSYTNDLLVQQQEMETLQLATQREMASKQLALRQAMAVCDTVRADQAELRKKLGVAQELAARAAADAKRWKVECEVRSKEVEGLEKFAEEARQEIDNLRGGAAARERRLAEAEGERLRAIEEMEQYSSEEASRWSKQRDAYDKQSRELAESKTALNQTRGELRVSAARCEDLERLVKQRDAEVKRLEDDLDRAKRNMQALEESERRTQMLEAQFKSDLLNEQSKSVRTRQQAEAAAAAAEARAAELDRARSEAQELALGNRALQEEVRELNNELETVGSDLLAQAQARAVDKERLETRVRELQDELGRLAAEARERERNAADRDRQRSQELAALRRSSEQQLAKLQEEHASLHTLLRKTQDEMEHQEHQHAQALADLEERARNAAERERTMRESSEAREVAAKREAGALLAEIQRLQNEATSRTAASLEQLGAMSSELQQLAADGQDLAAELDGCQDELASMRSDQAASQRAAQQSLHEWHAESKRSMGDLAAAANAARAELERTREQHLAAQVQRDEERARAIMLDEERSRLENEIAFLRESARGIEEASRERLEQLRVASESAMEEQGQVSRQAQALRAQLEEANAHNRTLQEERSRSQQGLKDAQARSTARVAALEQQLEDSEQRQRKAITDRDSLEADKELLRRSLQDANRTIQTLQQQVSSLEGQSRDGADRDKKHITSIEQQLASMREGVRNYQAQLTQTKGLLKVVQEQRKHLQEDNLGLRAELDEVLRRSLSEQFKIAPPTTPSRPKVAVEKTGHNGTTIHMEQPSLPSSSLESPHFPLDMDLEKLRREVEQLKSED